MEVVPYQASEVAASLGVVAHQRAFRDVEALDGAAAAAQVPNAVEEAYVAVYQDQMEARLVLVACHHTLEGVHRASAAVAAVLLVLLGCLEVVEVHLVDP